jgi:tetratricopeptide (TPR) repeat protein
MQLVGSAMDNVPLWVEIGCGEYLRTLQVDREAAAASRVIVGAPVARHVVALRSRGLPMLTVLSATRESPAFTDADSRRQFTAQSWLLVHYLLTERSREGQLSTFLDLLERHVEPEHAFQQAIGETHETIGHRLSDYYSRAVFATRALPMRLPESPERGGKRRLAAVPCLSAITSDVLVKSRASRGRGDETRALFEKAIARSGADADADAGAVMLARYYYGEWLVNQGADANAANRVLTSLLDILPDHPDLLALLGLADLGMHNPGSALRRFEEAIRIFPRHEYAILIARAEIAGGDVDSARADECGAGPGDDAGLSRNKTRRAARIRDVDSDRVRAAVGDPPRPRTRSRGACRVDAAGIRQLHHLRRCGSRADCLRRPRVARARADHVARRIHRAVRSRWHRRSGRVPAPRREMTRAVPSIRR